MSSTQPAQCPPEARVLLAVERVGCRFRDSCQSAANGVLKRLGTGLDHERRVLVVGPGLVRIDAELDSKFDVRRFSMDVFWKIANAASREKI
jgi:hypothetical protein